MKNEEKKSASVNLVSRLHKIPDAAYIARGLDRNIFSHRLGGVLRAWILAALFLTVINPAFSDETRWTFKKIGNNAVINSAKWCGSDLRIVWQGATSGVQLAELASNQITTITSSWQHVEPTCSPDGRYVIFQDEASRKVSAYDTETAEITEIPCLDKRISLSPDMKAAVAVADTCPDILLPWGEKLHVEKINRISLPNHYPPTVATWFPGNKKIILRFIKKPPKGLVPEHSTIAIYDIEKAVLTPIALPVSPYVIKTAQNGRYLYFLGQSRLSGTQRSSTWQLYGLNMQPLSSEAELIHPSITAYDFHEQIGLILITHNGILKIANPNGGKNQKFTKIDIRFESSDSPLFSPSGKRIVITKENAYLAEDGPEGPPITSSVYVLSKNP